ncbi:MAG: hypothetical protein IH957_07810 [Chloroflexi bacterium]|nr:hypothetical protein [Chloroflexota bacterium]
MRKAKFREIFEECLSAVLEGRRTVEDCLSLYPSIASELEPLLRTSLQISDVYQAETPPWNVQERIRHRVLAAAQARARGRDLVSGIDLSGSSWRARHWGGLGVAAAAAVAAVFMVSVMLIGGGGSDDGQFVATDLPVTVEPVATSFQSELDELRDLLLAEGRVDLDQIEQISQSAAALAVQIPDYAAFSDLNEPTQQALEDALADVDELLTPLVKDTDTPELDPVRKLLDNTKVLSEQWGEPQPSVTPVPTEEPEPEPTETPAPTETLAPTDGPEPTDTPAPSPTKAPSETPEATEEPEPTIDPSRLLQ